jgi:hypothetical protein
MENLGAVFLDAQKKPWATAQVSQESQGQFGGIIDLGRIPADLRSLFEEYEEIVNGQMLSFLDDIQRRIDGLNLQVAVEGASPERVTNLQIYPSTGDVSFHIKTVPTFLKSSSNGTAAQSR